MVRLGLLLIACCLLLPSCVGRGKPSPSDAQIARFAAACKNGDIGAVKAALGRYSASELVGAQDDCGCTPLHMAAKFGQPEVVALLVASGADTEAKDIWAQTPLRYAVCRTHKDTVKVLLEKGADPNSESDDGLTALFDVAKMTARPRERSHRS